MTSSSRVNFAPLLSGIIIVSVCHCSHTHRQLLTTVKLCPKSVVGRVKRKTAMYYVSISCVIDMFVVILYAKIG